MSSPPPGLPASLSGTTSTAGRGTPPWVSDTCRPASSHQGGLLHGQVGGKDIMEVRGIDRKLHRRLCTLSGRVLERLLLVELFSNSLRRYLNGEPLINEVNKNLLY